MTADEVAEIEKNKGSDGRDDDVADVSTVKTGSKRKPEGNSTVPNKKAKIESETPDEDEDEDAEDDS